MVVIGDTVLVLHDSVLLDATVQEISNPTDSEEKSAEEYSSGPEFLVHYVDSDQPDEWIAVDRVLQDTSKNRELQLKVNAIQLKRNEVSEATDVCGPGRLDAIVAWMNTVDDALVRLNKDVEGLLRAQADQAAQLNELERRKTEAEKTKSELEAQVLQDLKRVRILEETAMARKRLQTAGVSQEEIDAILPAKPRVSERGS
ncbi:Esa1p-associated factor [Phytophthora boehmeriae]|uniref:Esa1p-associated factor n=1 Tax=Phytophthora boehmeriae TaxID=109152 RepID=A0A8T1WKW1_9STRA|nr:Esa1p-associated factor [Phytophthora boehmeriae]